MRGEPVQKSDCRKYIPVGLDPDVCRGKGLFKEPLCRKRREAPVVPPAVHIMAADLADPWKGRQQDPARPQDAVKRLEGCAQIVNELERLRQNNAVECV